MTFHPFRPGRSWYDTISSDGSRPTSHEVFAQQSSNGYRVPSSLTGAGYARY
ncbi:hypothetical protein M404DRAFT_1006334 [Pisolithus tinctorius Marx 270]|uniref:Uncharacterized protein n=1 Tax=Pisolithus tinctorius Marx 270 TaxID=870435 RepID=A0A0C3JHG6_PISTI|nr:hypothetical protein M404DRAFT_1006334 [Pisolithus tinctorius Marx 270]